jgi:hypothetical protein
MADKRPTTGEGGVLGNLPHSRPGRRSKKRDAGRPAAAAGAAARKAEATDAAAARPARRRTSRSRRQAPAAAPKSARAIREEPSAGALDGETGGPIGGAVHAATKVAGTGVRVAGALAHEVLRRLPRP